MLSIQTGSPQELTHMFYDCWPKRGYTAVSNDILIVAKSRFCIKIRAKGSLKGTIDF